MASGCVYETDPNDPSDESSEEPETGVLNKDFAALAISPRQDGESRISNGEWMSDHPWQSCKPDPNLEMKDFVAISASYKLDDDWIKCQGRRQVVDLSKIFSNLPIFMQLEMQGSINGSRQELEQLVVKKHENFESPHTREIAVKNVLILTSFQKDKKSLPDDRRLKATSASSDDDYVGAIYNIDCEYMLQMNVAESMIPWFDIQQCDTFYPPMIRKISYPNKEKRWIFIPSFRRAQIALLDWPEDEFVTPDSTLRILVVRPSEFEEYVNYCGHMFPVISLPQDEIGAGYPRLWIQKIALRLKLDFIWMIDDSVECFYEYHPKMAPPERDDGTKNYTDYRRRRFGLVFERIEKFVKETKDENLPITAMSEKLVKETKDKNPPIAAMSPKRFMGGTKLEEPFVCKPPRIAVFLNIAALKSKEVYYRPELQALEDMIFGYECEKNGLKVFIDNRVHLQDKKWTDTGARSPSVQQKQA
ncbi:hypothetical protein ACROYT_G023055 [Oculina patagonica]